MPKTNFHKNHNNSLSQLFWGRIRFEAATALYYFERGSKSRKILHQVKYKGKKKLARYLGIIYGEELSNHEIFIDSDFVVPVPLHPSREKKRGFNQSEVFSRGIGSAFGHPVSVNNLVRISKTD